MHSHVPAVCQPFIFKLQPKVFPTSKSWNQQCVDVPEFSMTSTVIIPDESKSNFYCQDFEYDLVHHSLGNAENPSRHDYPTAHEEILQQDGDQLDENAYTLFFIRNQG